MPPLYVSDAIVAAFPVDAGYDPKTGEFEVEICIPVTPL